MRTREIGCQVELRTFDGWRKRVTIRKPGNTVHVPWFGAGSGERTFIWTRQPKRGPMIYEEVP